METNHPRRVFEVSLTQGQSDVVQTRLPSGYSIEAFSNVQKREQRISKKVKRYDASFENENRSSDSSPNVRQQRSGSKVKQLQQTASSREVIKPISEEMRKCLGIFNKLQQHKEFSFFYLNYINRMQQPSSYSGRVKSPIEVEKIEKSLNSGNYSKLQFWQDVKSMFSEAARTFSDEYRHLTEQLESYFNELYSSLEAKPARKVPEPPPRKKQQQQAASEMSYKDKKILGENIRKLPVEFLRGVWEIVSQGEREEDKDEIEFDIDKLDAQIARQLERYVNSKLQGLQKRRQPNNNASTSHQEKRNAQQGERSANHRTAEKPKQISQFGAELSENNLKDTNGREESLESSMATDSSDSE